ncbi:relaxase [Peptoniphilus pacaensis]
MISVAITKIHPIKSTLNLTIDYITKGEKTDENVLVSSLFTSFVSTL